MPEEDLIASRRRKLEALASLAGEAWPRRFDPSHSVTEAVAELGPLAADELESRPRTVRLGGRIVAIRAFGKAAFLVLGDGKSTIQAWVRKDRVQAPGFDVYRLLDVGDFVGVEGEAMRTRSGELTVDARSLAYLAKALKPLPEKWHGLQDVEARYRQRYVDLIVNPEVRQAFEVRIRLIRELRRFLDQAGFLEVETPMMHPIAGGAAARPFVTRHNALGMELCLRIAPELYLKRLLVGGLERVYELNRNFRNEGISIRHNPEFTMLEFYQAYADLERFKELVEELLVAVTGAVLGGTVVEVQGRKLDLGRRPFARLSMLEAVRRALGARPELGFDPGRVEDADALARFSDGLDRGETPRYRGASWGERLYHLFEDLVEPELWQPTLVDGFPVEVSPLAKRSPHDPRFVERFELFVAGLEVANAFSELNDPDDQLRRFEEQAAARAAGDAEAHPMDRDFVDALMHGMPPAAGCGIGVDRLAMILADRRSIRDVIFFPLLRPR
jgi:lysyl-tRNA synthetase class 2